MSLQEVITTYQYHGIWLWKRDDAEEVQSDIRHEFDYTFVISGPKFHALGTRWISRNRRYYV